MHEGVRAARQGIEVREIGVALDHRKVHKDRQEWRDILEKEV